MPRSRIVVIGASAGGFEAVTTVRGAVLTPTREQAWLSTGPHRPSRRKTRSGPNGWPRRTSRRRM